MTATSEEADRRRALELLAGIARDGIPSGARVLDVRPRAAFEGAHVPGSSHIDPEEIDVPFLLPPRNRRLIVLADEAERAVVCAARLRAAGYEARGVAAPIADWPGAWEAGPERVPSWEPSPLVAAWADRIPRGEALDLACGSGRDAVYLALRGHRVTAIDVLPDALAQGERLARRHGVAVRFVRADVEGDPGSWTGPWTTIQVHRYLHRPALPLLRERLAPGGTLLYETFTTRQAAAGRKPRNPAHLLREGELLAAAQGLEILEHREGETENGDWTAALVARRKEGDA